MPTRASSRAFNLLLASFALGVTAQAEAASAQKQSGSMKPPALSYQPVAFSQIPGWDRDDHAAAFKAFLKSCDRVLAAGRERAAGDKLPGPPPGLIEACTAAGKLTARIGKEQAKAFFERHFTANAL